MDHFHENFTLDRKFLHRHRLWCLWQIWGMVLGSFRNSCDAHKGASLSLVFAAIWPLLVIEQGTWAIPHLTTIKNMKRMNDEIFFEQSHYKGSHRARKVQFFLSIIVATGVYALLLKFLQKNSPHNVQTNGGAFWRLLKKNCTFILNESHVYKFCKSDLVQKNCDLFKAALKH